MKINIFGFVTIIVLGSFFFLSNCHAGDIYPQDLAKPVFEYVKVIDKTSALACCGKNSDVINPAIKSRN